MIFRALLFAMLPVVALAEVPQGPPNAPFAPAFSGQTRAEALPATPIAVTTFAEGLNRPWGIARLPSGAISGDRAWRLAAPCGR